MALSSIRMMHNVTTTLNKQQTTVTGSLDLQKMFD